VGCGVRFLVLRGILWRERTTLSSIANRYPPVTSIRVLYDLQCNRRTAVCNCASNTFISLELVLYHPPLFCIDFSGSD